MKFAALAVGFYGSIARNADGPYSDIELHCITREGPGSDLEWIHDGWSIDVSIRSRASILAQATKVPGNWAISHANYFYVSPVHDPGNFFVEPFRMTMPMPGRYLSRATAVGAALHSGRKRAVLICNPLHTLYSRGSGHN